MQGEQSSGFLALTFGNSAAKRVLVFALLLSVSGCWRAPTGSSVSRSGGVLTVRIGSTPRIEGSGVLAEEEREVGPFTGIAAHHGVDVIFSDQTDAVVVLSDINLLPFVETVVESGRLEIRVANSLQAKNPLKVVIPISQLEVQEPLSLQSTSSSTLTTGPLDATTLRLKVSCSGKITCGAVTADQVDAAASSSGAIQLAAINAPQLKLKASSSGTINAGQIVGENLTVEASSSGRVIAAGAVDQQEVSASSSGKYDGAKLASLSSEVQASSSGSIEVQAATIVGSASSAGKIRYHNGAERVEVKTSSGGRAWKAG